MTNAIGFLGFEHQAVSHMTGATSLLGVALAQGQWQSVSHLWGMLIAFCIGAAFSGLVIQDSTLRLGRRYGWVLMVEAALLLVAIPLFKDRQIWGALAAAGACGMQNALATTFSGAIVRTTHLTGMFTDLGMGLGHMLRGLPAPIRRLTLSGLIISGFLAGSILGAALFFRVGYDALLAPALLTGGTGLAYVSYKQFKQLRSRA